MFNNLFKTAAWPTTLRLLIVSLLHRGTLTCNIQLPMSSSLSTGQSSINQPAGETNSPQPTKNRASLAMKYQQHEHLLSFMWHCISGIKTQQLLIKELKPFQILAWLKHRPKDTRSTIDSIKNRSPMPALDIDTDPMHHAMPLRIEPSTSTSSDRINHSYPCHRIIHYSTMFFLQAAARNGYISLSIWDKVQPSMV
jgi:hypothetical protein